MKKGFSFPHGETGTKSTSITSEKLIHKQLKKVVEAAGGLIYKNHPLTDGGIPDCIVHMKGEASFYVETKTTGEECTPLQKEFHRTLKQKTGVDTFVLDQKVKTFDDIKRLGYTIYDSEHFYKNPFKNN